MVLSPAILNQLNSLDGGTSQAFPVNPYTGEYSVTPTTPPTNAPSTQTGPLNWLQTLIDPSGLGTSVASSFLSSGGYYILFGGLLFIGVLGLVLEPEQVQQAVTKGAEVAA